MKKIIATVLLLIMMVTVCACGNNTAGNVPTENDNSTNHEITDNTENTENTDNNENSDQQSDGKIDAGAMILTELGTVPDGVNFISGDIIVKYEGTGANRKVQILNQNGVSFNDKWYGDVDSIISNGICVVSNTDASGKAMLGVVDSINEKELVPCEAVEISKLSDRFILLGYETGAGTDDDKFGNYFIEFDMVEYKGYGKILDLEKGQLVPNLEITTSKYDVSAAGNMIYVEKKYPATDVYTAEGKLAGSYEYINVYPESGIALQSTDEGICVYDQDMKLVSTLEADSFYEYEPIDGTSEMLVHGVNGRYCVTDLEGKALTADYARIVEVYSAGYLYVSENDASRIVDFAGNTIVSEFYTLQYADPGYFIAYVTNEGYYVYDGTGKKINETAMAEASGLLIRGADGRVLVLETGERLAYASELTGSLVQIGSAVYDVISGKAALTDVDDCVATGNNLYVWDNEKETYTRYTAEFKSES